MRVTKAQVAELRRIAAAGGVLPLSGSGVDVHVAHDLAHLEVVELVAGPGIRRHVQITDLGRRAIDAGDRQAVNA